MEGELENFLALKADMVMCFTHYFSNKQWPPKASMLRSVSVDRKFSCRLLLNGDRLSIYQLITPASSTFSMALSNLMLSRPPPRLRTRMAFPQYQRLRNQIYQRHPPNPCANQLAPQTLLTLRCSI